MRPRPPGKALSLRGFIDGDRAGIRVVKLPGDVRDWQVKCVCGGRETTCNNGWMRRIEDRAKPALVPLIKGERTQLSPAQQQEIAAWASLKSIFSEYLDDKGPITNHGQRKLLMRRGKPPDRGWAVWIGHFERQAWKVEWSNHAFLVVNKEKPGVRADQPRSHFNSNSTTQVIGKLFINVLHCPERTFVEKWRFSLPDKGTLSRIWPPARHGIEWPGLPMTDADADTATDAISEFLFDIKRGKA